MSLNLRGPSQAALSATVAAQSIRPNTWASIGDSISARAAALNGSGGSAVDRRSWQFWTNVILGQRLEPYVTYAVSGKRADEMVTEQLPTVLALSAKPGYCTVLGGTNDLIAGRTDTQIIASLQTIIDGLRGAGIRPVVGTILPRAGLTATQSKYLVRVNAWLRTYAPTVGAILVDWYGALADSAGAPVTNALASDGIHPTVRGAVLMARAAAVVLSQIIPPVPRLPQSNLESPNPNILSTPMMTGTTGTKWDAGITGSVATNWISRSSDGAAVTVAASKIVRTDVPGEWQQLAQTAGAGVMHYQSVTDPTRYTAGDQLYGLVEVECDADLSSATTFEVSLIGTGGQTSEAPKKVGDDAYSGAILAPVSGVYRTPTITAHSGLTDLRLRVQVIGGAATFRIGRAAILIKV